MAKRLNVELAFTADTGQAKAAISGLQQSLNNLTTGAKVQGNKLGLTTEINEATQKANQLKAILASSTNSKGVLDINKFNQGLKDSGTSLKQYAQSLNSLGPEGAKAFQQLSRSIATSTVSIQKANTVLSEMWTTMKNTVRWQLTSSALHSFIGGLHEAYGYAKNLNKTLTDIRIVAPEKGIEDMAKFSKLANQQAKQLSSTTLDYAKGALIYYQQGLDDVQVKARTDVTTMMANVTGDSTDDVSSYMTAIWNNFNRAGDESEEHFADILTRLGADSAASTSEITSALEKYSGVASTIGLSYEAATAAATTLIDRLRETPEVAGTALKTVFARLEGLKQGETLEDDTDLNKYSQGLANVGVNIKDANGELKDMDTIIDEVGNAWQSLDKDQKVALAQTVAGVRQWNQFAALMDNFDVYKRFKEDAESASGSLKEQQEIYAESWEAASNRAKSAMQGIYQAVLDDKFFISLTNGFAKVLEAIGELASGMGGLKTLLPLLGTLMLRAFGDDMAKSIDNLTGKLKGFGKNAAQEAAATKQKAMSILGSYTQDETLGGNAKVVGLQNFANAQQKYLENAENMTESARKNAEIMLDAIDQTTQGLIQQGNELQKQESELNKRDADIETMHDAYSGDINNPTHLTNLQKGLMITAQKKGALSTLNDSLTNPLNSIESNVSDLKEKRNTLAKLKTEEQTEEAKKEISKLESEISKLEARIDADIQQVQARAQSVSENNPILERSAGLEKLKNISSKDSLEKQLKDLQEGAGSIKTELDKTTTKELKSKKAYRDEVNKNEDLKQEINVDKITKDAEKFGEANVKMSNDMADSRKEVDNFGNAIDNFNKKLPTGGEMIMSLGNACMSLAGTIMAVKNAIDVFSDSDATLTESIIAALTVLGMAIPTIISIIDAIKILTPTNLATAAASLAAAAGLEAETIALAKAEIAAGRFGSALKLIGPKLLSMLGPLLLVAAAIAAVVAGVTLLYKHEHSANKNFERLSENADQASNNLNKVKDSVNSLNSSMESIDSKRDALRNMTYGTKEWRDAVADLNSEVKNSIQDFNEMNDQIQGKASLDEVNKRIKEKGGKETSSIDMIMGEDYYYDSEGVLNYTVQGELKLDAVSDILVDNASIVANNLAMDTKNAEIAKNKEDFFNTGPLWSGTKQYQHSDEYADSNTKNIGQGRVQRTVAATSDQFNEQAYNAIVQALGNGSLDASIFEGDTASDEIKKWLTEEGGLNPEVAASMADLIVSNKDLKEQLVQHGNTIAESNELTKQLAASDIMNNEKTQDAIFGDKSGLTEQQKQEYGNGVVEVMSQDVASAKQSYIDQKGTVAKLGKYGTWAEDKELYQEDYLKEMGYTEGEDGKWTNKEGDEKELSDIEYKDVESLLAYEKALEKVNARVEDYKALIKDTEKDNKALANVKKLYEENADAIDEAGDALKKEGATLKSLEKDNNKAATALKKFTKEASKDLAEALDLPDGSILDPEFVGKNLDIIKDAMDGDVEAIQKVQKELANWNLDHLNQVAQNLNLDIDLTQAKDQLSELNNILQTDLQDYEVGVTINDADFTQGVADATAALMDLGVTGNDIGNSIAASLGGSVEVVGYEDVVVDVGQGSDSKGNIVKTVEGTIPYVDENGKVIEQPFHTTLSDDTKLTTNDDGETVMRVPIFKKSANVPKASSGGGGGGRRRGGGGGGRGGGGRGGRGGRRTRAEHQRKEKKIDPYKQVTKNIEKLARATEKVQDNNEKLYGKKQLNNMEEVNSKLRAELKAIQKKNDLTSKYISLNRTRIKDELNYWQKILGKNGSKVVKNLSKGPDFTFDEFGNISNYNKVMDRYQTARDKLIDTMNTKKTKEAQDKFKEKYLDPLDQAIEGINAQVEEYESHIETHLQEIDDWSDKFNEVLENIYEHANTQVELNLTVNDNASKLVDYYISKLEDDVYKIGELYDKMFGAQNSQYANILDKMDIYLNKTYSYTDAAQKYTTEGTYFEYYEKLYKSGQITQANYVEAMQKGYDELIDSASSLLDLQKEMDDYYLNAIDLIRQKLEPYYDSIAGGVEALEHWKNVIDLTGNGKDYNQLINVQSKLLDLTRQRYNFAVQERDKQQEAYNNFSEQYKNALSNDYALFGITEEQHDWAIKQAEDMASTLQERNQEVADNAEDLLNAGKEQLELTIEQARRDIEEFLSGVEGGFEQLQKQMSLSSTRQEEYLTKTNQIYEMNKMLRTLRSDIDKTDNKAAKQRLSNFSKELDNLKEKDRLSNLELKIAQAKYEQLKAQIALEEAQNAKSIVRLSRDNEGNYGYVYTANKEDVDKAQEELDNANNSLYNILLEANNDYNEKIISYVSQMLDEIDAIRNNSELSDEEKDDLINAIRNKYSAILDDAEQLLGIATSSLTNEFNAFQEAWSNEYAKNINNMLEAIKNQAIDNWENIVKDEYDQFAQLGSSIANTDLEAINSALQLAYDAVSKLGEKGGLLDAYSNLDETLKKMDEYIATIPKINEKIGKIETTLEAVKKILDSEASGDGTETYYDYNKLLEYIAELNGTSVKRLDFGAVDFSASGKSIDEIGNINPEQNKKAKQIWQQIEMGARGWLGLDENGNLKAVYNTSGRTDSEAYAESKKKLATALYKFDTGGYTGAWGSKEGKLAMLHEKELVLNAQDTKNMLETVDIVRSIVNAIDTNVLSIGANLSSAGVPQTGGELNQNVSISAEFPAVQDRHEIEAAFDNLINRAAQFANRTR